MTHRYVLSILVENHSGVLRRVSSLFARRGYNIESLSVGVTQDPELSRITVAVKGDEYIIDQIKKQVFKLVEVRKIEPFIGSLCLSRSKALSLRGRRCLR